MSCFLNLALHTCRGGPGTAQLSKEALFLQFEGVRVEILNQETKQGTGREKSGE